MFGGGANQINFVLNSVIATYLLVCPRRMAAGMTSHKIQGQTVTQPNCLVVDVRDTFAAGMVYVMLSRVCNIEQLFILEELDSKKIKVSEKVLKENRRMESVSVNENPTPWNNLALKGTRVSSLNVRSLRKHMEDVRGDFFLLRSDVICLQEIWLEEGEQDQERYQMKDYNAFFNCQGRGKGLATYVRAGKFKHDGDVTTPHLQMTKLTGSNLDVISVYRSQEAAFRDVVNQLKMLINLKKNTMIIGDFNYCHLEEKNDLSQYLAEQQFQQLVTTATHIEGSLLDHAHYRRVEDGVAPVVEMFAEYYTDHDAVTALLM